MEAIIVVRCDSKVKGNDKSEKSLTCGFCAKHFKGKDAKLQHERTHTGEKPFMCQFCDKRFCSKSNKNSHEKIHRKDKMFECKYTAKCGLLLWVW